MTRFPRGKLSNILPPVIWIVHFNRSKECHWQRLQNYCDIVFKALELLPWSIFLKTKLLRWILFSYNFSITGMNLKLERRFRKNGALHILDKALICILWALKSYTGGIWTAHCIQKCVPTLKGTFAGPVKVTSFCFFCLFVLLRLYHDPLYRKKAGYNYSVYF